MEVNKSIKHAQCCCRRYWRWWTGKRKPLRFHELLPCSRHCFKRLPSASLWNLSNCPVSKNHPILQLGTGTEAWRLTPGWSPRNYPRANQSSTPVGLNAAPLGLLAEAGQGGRCGRERGQRDEEGPYGAAERLGAGGVPGAPSPPTCAGLLSTVQHGDRCARPRAGQVLLRHQPVAHERGQRPIFPYRHEGSTSGLRRPTQQGTARWAHVLLVPSRRRWEHRGPRSSPGDPGRKGERTTPRSLSKEPRGSPPPPDSLTVVGHQRAYGPPSLLSEVRGGPPRSLSGTLSAGARSWAGDTQRGVPFTLQSSPHTSRADASRGLHYPWPTAVPKHGMENSRNKLCAL